MFLGGGIYTISEDDEESFEEKVTNNGYHHDDRRTSKRSEKHVHFAVRLICTFLKIKVEECSSNHHHLFK